MKKILFVVNNLSFLLSHRLEIALEALKIGWEVHVAAPVNDDISVIRSHGFIFHPIKITRSSMNPFGEIATMAELFGLYKRLRPDILHHITIKPVIYGGIAARLSGMPAVVSAIPGLGFIFLDRKILAKQIRAIVKSMYRIVLGHKNMKVIFQNPDDLDLFVSNFMIDKNKTVLIRGSGVDISHFTPTQKEPAKTPIVLMPSRLLWDKGVKEFIESAIYIQKKNIDAKFVLAGDTDSGNPSSVPVEQLEKWGSEKIIEWIGFEKNMPALFAKSDIVVLPSYREGLPKVLIEAASCGLPIVTTDTPGCREIVKNGKNGLLVPPRDSLSLADA